MDNEKKDVLIENNNTFVANMIQEQVNKPKEDKPKDKK